MRVDLGSHVKCYQKGDDEVMYPTQGAAGLERQSIGVQLDRHNRQSHPKLGHEQNPWQRHVSRIEDQAASLVTGDPISKTRSLGSGQARCIHS